MTKATICAIPKCVYFPVSVYCGRVINSTGDGHYVLAYQWSLHLHVNTSVPTSTLKFRTANLGLRARQVSQFYASELSMCPWTTCVGTSTSGGILSGDQCPSCPLAPQPHVYSLRSWVTTVDRQITTGGARPRRCVSRKDNARLRFGIVQGYAFWSLVECLQCGR